MDIHGIRLKRYNQLLREFKARPDQQGLANHGLLTRFAGHGGVSVRYLSHINNGRKNIGDALARQLEVGFGKPHGWLDNDADLQVSLISDAETDFSALALRLFRESPTEVQNLLMRYMLDKLDSKKIK